MKNRLWRTLPLVLCLMPASAYADAGVPMLALMIPGFGFTLIPIIVIEAYIFKRAGFAFKWALKWNALANVATTFIGIPLTWMALVFAEMMAGGGHCHDTETLPEKLYAVIAEAPWLCPYEHDLHWMIPCACLLLLIPFFFVSWLAEAKIISITNRSYDAKLIRRTSLKANLASYGLLVLCSLSLFFL